MRRVRRLRPQRLHARRQRHLPPPLVLPLLYFLPMLLSSCVNHLPDQDLRILATAPTDRLSADILWKDYAADPKKANGQYFGEAIVVTGTATSFGSNAPTDRFILFGQTKDFGVRANLLDEQAGEILERIAKEPRISLKCFCEGLNGHVILKSCVAP
jgi:hypothetical protein